MYSENTAKSILDEHFVAPATTKALPVPEHLLRAKLQRLCTIRFGNHVLPDDNDGRAMLTALLRFGLTDEAAIEDAPWCAAELATLKRRAKRMKWCEVGTMIGLTFEEWKQIKPPKMKPIDASDADLEAWRKERRKASNRKSKAKQREKERLQKQMTLTKAKTMETTPREDAILEMMIDRDRAPMSVPEIMKLARKSHAFMRSRYRNCHFCSGPPANTIVRNLRSAVHRTLAQLERKGVVETYSRPGERGSVTWARLTLWRRQDEQPFIFDAKNERRTVASSNTRKAKEKQHVIGKSGMSASNKNPGMLTDVCDSALSGPQSPSAGQDNSVVIPFPLNRVRYAA